MDDKSTDEEEWVIWNGAHGLVTTVAIGRVEVGTCGRNAWLDEPFDMVGPFSLDELKRLGRIAFAACIEAVRTPGAPAAIGVSAGGTDGNPQFPALGRRDGGRNRNGAGPSLGGRRL